MHNCSIWTFLFDRLKVKHFSTLQNFSYHYLSITTFNLQEHVPVLHSSGYNYVQVMIDKDRC